MRTRSGLDTGSARLELTFLGSWSLSGRIDGGDLGAAVVRLLADSQGPAAFLRVPSDDASEEAVTRTAAAVHPRFGKVLTLGIGGSALGAQAAIDALKPHRPPSGREVRFLSNLDPASVADALEWFHPDDTLLVAITKSGTTIETLTQFALFAERIRAVGGEEALRDGIVVITDPERGALRRIAGSIGCRTLDVPRDVGGRFSVLTPVGLFPIALAGLDTTRLLRGARAMVEALRAVTETQDFPSHPSVLSAAMHYAAWDRTAIRVLWGYGDRLATLGDWFCQLWAESLGKVRATDRTRVGQMPVRAVGSTDQHSLLQIAMEGPANLSLTFLTVGGPWPSLRVPDPGWLDSDLREFAGKEVVEIFDALRMGTVAALVQAGRPLAHLHVERLDEEAVGALFAHFEIETALCGYLLGINPFDQPGVEAGKRFAHGLLGKEGHEGWGEEARRYLDADGREA